MKEYIIILSDASLNIVEASSFAEARRVALTFVEGSSVRIVAVRQL